MCLPLVQGAFKQGEPCGGVDDAGGVGIADTLDALGRDNKYVKPLTTNKKE